MRPGAWRLLGPLAWAGWVLPGLVAALALLAAGPAGWLLPAWKVVVSWITPELVMTQFTLDDAQVRLVAGIGRDLLVGHQWLPADPRHRLQAGVPLGPALLLPALLLAVAALLAWPGWGRSSQARQRGIRVALALALAAAAALLETPLLLAAAVHDELMRQLSPHDTSPLIAFAQWLNHGGRWWSAAAAAAALGWPLLGSAQALQRTASVPLPAPEQHRHRG